MFNPPVFKSAIYDGASVLAIWQPAANPGIAVTGYLVTVSAAGGSSIPATFPGAGTSVGRVPTGALDTAATYTITVCAQASGQPNACAPPVTLIVLQPVLTSVDGTASAVRMTWTPVARSISSIVSYTMSIFPTGGGVTTSVTIESPTATSGTIPLPTPVSGAYSVQVFANTGFGVSSATPVTAINTALPSLASASYNGLEVSAAWIPPANPTQSITGYTVFVGSPDGRPSFSATAPTAQTLANVPLPVPLDPAARYTVTVSANAGSVVSTSSSAHLLVMQPRMRSVDWNGTRLAAAWDPVRYPDPVTTGYQLTTYGVGGGQMFMQAIANAYAGSGQIANPVFTSGIAYLCTAAAQTAFSQASSTPVAIFTATPQITAVEFDGRQVMVRWDAFTPAAPPVQSFVVAVRASHGPSFTKTVENPAAVSAVVDAAGIAGSNLAYSVAVSAVAACGVTATSAAIALVVALPALESATYDGAGVLAEWTPPAGVTVTSYVLRLVAADGTTLESTSFSPGQTSGTLTLANPLSPTAGWTVTVVASTATMRVLAPPAALVTELPVLQASAFDGTHVALRWTPSLTSSPPVAGYELKVYSMQGGGTGITAVANASVTQGSVAIPGSASLAYVTRVCARRGSVFACTPAQAVMQATVAISGVHYDGRNVIATWGAVSGATAYAVAVVSSSGTIVDVVVTATTAVLPVVCDPTQTYAVSVRAIGSIATGPVATATIIAVVPRVTQIVTRPVQGNTSAHMVVTIDTSSSGPGVVGYEGSLYAGDQIVAGPIAAVTANQVTTVTIPYSYSAYTQYQVRVQAMGASASTTGPLGGGRAVISASPAVRESSYDGTAVHASWSAVEQPGVTGYQLTIMDTTSQTAVSTVTTADRSAAVPASLALSHSYTVSVQAIGDAAIGPPSAAANPLADATGYFFPASSASPYAYVFRGDIRGPGPRDIIVYLPALFGTPPSTISVSPFVLQRVSDPVNTSLPYTLTVAQNASINVWSITANGIRGPLQAAYLAFLQQVEAPANNLLPGAMAMLRQAIAQALPLSFAETLYYTCGLDPVAGYVNLQPGMRLRVDFETRQFVSPDPGGLSGFVGTGTSAYSIDALASGGSVATIFDPFLGSMTLPVVAANTGGGAGVIDLQGSRFQQAYLRLFYPPTFPSSDSGGAIGAAQNAVIVGAPSIAKLEEATTVYLRNRDFSGVTGISWTYFRGRATLIPEIACVVRGAATYVSLGSTVRNLAERFSLLPFRQGAPVQGVAYRRSIGQVVDAPAQVATGYPYLRTNAVQFGFQPASAYQYSGGLDCFDLPVLPGDLLDFGA